MLLARQGDQATTPCFRKPPISSIDVCQAARTFIEGRPVATLGDLLLAAGAVTTSGSYRVLVEGKPAHRVGDSNSCGGSTITGSSKALAG